MTRDEAERAQAFGESILEAIGSVPAGYAFACELPAAHGVPLRDLDQMWTDRWDANDRDWFVVLNGTDDPQEVGPLAMSISPGVAAVVADSRPLCLLTPIQVRWWIDPDTGDRLVDEAPKEIEYWEDQLLQALHGRLVDKGKDLPPLGSMSGTQTDE